MVVAGGRGIYNLGDGAVATATVNNTIIGQADTLAEDFTGSTINAGTSTTSGAGNLIRTQSGFVGTVASTADPLLGALAANGGMTRTHALLGGSPALDLGADPAAAGLATDQRCFSPRVANATVDIGAFELGAAAPAEPVFQSGTATTFTVGELGVFQVAATSSVPVLYYAAGLPGWARLDAVSGVLTGTPPSTSGSPSSITLTAVSCANVPATQTLTLTLAP